MAGSCCLKLMLQAVNDETCMGLAQPLTMKSLESLDSWTFRQILIYLINQTQMINKQGLERDYRNEVMVTRSSTPITPIEYDATVDHVYWALRELFPAHDDLVTYHLLLFPDKDGNGKRVKAVLNYLTSFVFFCDESVEAFEIIHEEVQLEHQSRQDLHEEIEDTKVKTSDRIVFIEDRKEQVPLFVEKLREVNAAVHKEEMEVAYLEVAVRESKMLYDELDVERLRMERRLEDAVAERKYWESQIVRDPESILKAERDEQLKLERLLGEREAIGRKIGEISRSGLAAEALITKANYAVNELLECIAGIDGIEKIHEQIQIAKREVHKIKVLVGNMKGKLAAVNKSKEKLKQRIVEKRQGKLRKKDNLVKQAKQIKEKLQEMKEVDECHQEKRAELKEYISVVQTCNRELQARIDEHTEFLEVTLPEIMKRIAEETKEAYEVFVKHISADGDIY